MGINSNSHYSCVFAKCNYSTRQSLCVYPYVCVRVCVCVCFDNSKVTDLENIKFVYIVVYRNGLNKFDMFKVKVTMDLITQL